MAMKRKKKTIDQLNNDNSDCDGKIHNNNENNENKNSNKSQIKSQIKRRPLLLTPM